MAEEASDTSTSKPNVELSSTKKHHKQTSLSYNRPKYRESRWERAVKVYTINLESKYVLVQGVPAVGAVKELLELFALYGAIQEYRILDDYPTEPFTEVYWIKFDRINSARVAKKKLDNRSFFGGILHVCYAPEFETVDDTREKLQERRKVMAKKTRELFGGQQKTSLTKVSPPAELSLKRPIEEHKSITASTLENQRLQANGGLPNHTKETPPGSLYQPANSTEYTLPSSSPYDYPTLLPPPQHFYPFQYPPPPPPWDLPRVPSSHATLPACMQILLPTPPPPPAPAPPPPPPPPLPPTESSVCDDSKTSERSAQGKPCTVYMTQVMIGPQREQGASSNKASLTGDDSLDKTAISIRNRMRQLTRTHEDSTFPTQNIQVVQQNPAGSAVSSVPKKKRKRI